MTATAATTETETTVAEPDGTLTTTVSALPTRVRRDGRWVPLDANLAPNPDGTYSPAATPVRLALSGSRKSNVLASMTNHGATVELRWPTELPPPTIAGPSALYAEVFSGVDLKVTATEQGGFSHVLIVRTAAAATNSALRSLRLTTVTSPGVTLSSDENGNVAVVDAQGRTLYTAPTPIMWDSTSPPPISGRPMADHERPNPERPGSESQRAAVGVDVGDGAVTLVPDAALLTGDRTRFPLYIDPSWNANSAVSTLGAWTYVDSAHPDQAYLNSKWNDGIARVGYNGWERPYGVAQSYFQFKVPTATWGTKVISATLQMTQIWSAADVTATLRVVHTCGIDKTTTWKKQPCTYEQLDKRNVAPVANPGNFPQVDFVATAGFANAAASRSPLYTVGIFNGSDTNRDMWRKFKSNPTVAIKYNAVPNVPAGAQSSPQTPCAGGLVGNTAVTLSATLSDPDGTQTQIQGDYVVTDETAKKVLATPSVTVSNKKPAAVTLAPEKFTDGHTYSWKLTAYDGRDRSAPTKPCYFTVNHKQPLPPVVDDTAPDVIAPRTPVGFTFAAAAGSDKPKSYVYSLNVPPPATIPVQPGPFPGGTLVTAAPDGQVTSATITPRRIGRNVLYAYAVNAAGNPGPVTAHEFTTTGLAQPDRPGDLTGDGIPDFAHVGASSRPGLWLYPGTDKSGKVTAVPSNIGSAGMQGVEDGTAADWNGATTGTADLDDDGLQDVLVTVPGGSEGNVHYLPGVGDGSPLDPVTAQAVRLPRIDGEDGDQVVDQVVAPPVPGAADTTVPDLYAVVGDELYLYRARSIPGAYDSPDLVGTGWAGRTVTAARAGTRPALFARDDATGTLELWTVTPPEDPSQAPTATVRTIAANGFGRGAVPLIAGADIDADGRADLWSVAANGDLRAHRPADVSPLPAPVVTAAAVTAPASPRIAVLGTDGVAWIKDGGLNPTWTRLHENVKQVVVSGDRVGVVLADGTAWITEGPLGTPWVKLYDGVSQLALAGKRIGVLAGGVAWVKEGAVNAAWVKENSSVSQLVLAGNRIGVLKGGAALVKEGALNAGWVQEHTSVTHLALAGNRIGVLRSDGVAWVKEGALNAGWVKEYDKVSRLALSGNRIGVVGTDKVARVKEGKLNAAWVVQQSGVTRLVLAGNRIGIVDGEGYAWVKQGLLNAPWAREGENADDVGLV